jgi:hypothetical protein
MAVADMSRNSLVDFKIDARAPEPPPIGVAITLEQPVNPAQFRIGDPVMLHGAYRADLDLIRLCKEGLPNSIMLAIYRVDEPWGEIAVLRASKIGVPPPGPAPGEGDAGYRRGGQFHLNVMEFFRLSPEPSRYIVQAVVGPYVSGLVGFELRPR